jgi:hypothetical protein
MTPDQKKAAFRYFSIAQSNKGKLHYKNLVDAAKLIKGLEGKKLMKVNLFLGGPAKNDPGNAYNGLLEIEKTGIIPE